MTHLRIEQNNGVIEEVSSSVITKLYEIAHAGLDVSSNLQGRLHVSKAYGDEIDWLTTHYPNLYIIADNRYIRFEDDDTFRFFLASIGDGIGITQQDMSTVTTSTFTFKNNTTLTNLNDFKYCTGIADIYYTGNMFAGMSNLEQITLPATIARLPANCFQANSKLQKINCLGDITLINHRALENCTHLTEFKSNGVDILQSTSLEDIQSLSFYNCSISGDVNLPNLQNLSSSFVGCTNITSVTSIGNLTWFPNQVFQGCTGLTTVTAASGITNYGTACFRECSNLETINMPSSIVLTNGDNNNPDQQFSGCQKLQFPQNFTINSNGVVTYFQRAFENCKRLTSITVGSTFTQIGWKAFENCTALTTVNHSAPTIGNAAFSGCTALSNLDMSGVKVIHPRALYNCSSLTGDLVLTGVIGTTSNSQEVIEDGALYGTGYNTITISSNTLKKITIGQGAGKQPPIGNCANLTKINLSGCTALNYFDGARNCPKLTTVILPESCYEFNSNAFQNSNALESVVVPYDNVATLPTGNAQQYFMTSPTGKIYVPATYVNDYKTTYPYFESRIDSFIHYPGEWEFVDKTFTAYEYEGCGFSSVVIKGNASALSVGCFKDSTNLQSVTLPSTITSLRSAAFTGCTSLENINLDYITDIFPEGGLGANGCFYGCTNLFKDTGIVHMPNLTRITGAVFQNCSYIKMFIAENLENVYRSDFPFSGTAIQAYIAPKANKIATGDLFIGGDQYHANGICSYNSIKVWELGKITSISKQALRSQTDLTAVVLHQQDTIITLSNYSSGDAFSVYFPNQNVKIYVPDSMVASYQADSVWSNFTSYIAPISEYDFSDHISDSSLVSYYNSVFNSSAS